MIDLAAIRSRKHRWALGADEDIDALLAYVAELEAFRDAVRAALDALPVSDG